ncbi:MAG: hypothetical protein WBL93_10505 [Lutisporaceae bacterium]
MDDVRIKGIEFFINQYDSNWIFAMDLDEYDEMLKSLEEGLRHYRIISWQSKNIRIVVSKDKPEISIVFHFPTSFDTKTLPPYVITQIVEKTKSIFKVCFQTDLNGYRFIYDHTNLTDLSKKSIADDVLIFLDEMTVNFI